MKLFVVLLAVVALCHGRALEELKAEPKKETLPKGDTPKESLETRAIIVDETAAFLAKHNLAHPDCTKTFPHRHEVVELVKEVPLIKVAPLKEKVNIQHGLDVKTLIPRDAEEAKEDVKEGKAKTDELAKKETEKAKDEKKDEKAPTSTPAPKDTRAAEKKDKPAAKPEDPKKPVDKKEEEKKPAQKVRRAVKEELDMKKVQPLQLTKDDVKTAMKAEKEDKKRTRRSYGGSNVRDFDDDDDDDDFDSLRSSGYSFATRTLPALRSSSHGGLAARSGYGKSLSFARSAPELFRSSGYGSSSLICEAPELEIRSSGYGGSFARDFDDDDLDTRAGYGKSLSFAHDASDLRSGYGGAALIREAPELEIRSSGYGGLVRGDFDDDDFSSHSRAGYGKSLSFARDASDFRSSGYGGASLIREAPELEIRSSGYGGSFARDFDDDDFSSHSRAGYGKSLSFNRDASGYGGASLVREAPELEIRSSGYGASLARDFDDDDFSSHSRAGYGKSLSFARDASGYGGASLVREAPELEIRSSGYGGSFARDFDDDDFSSHSRAGYGKSLSFARDASDFRSSGYGGASLIREAPELEIRSAGYGGASVRDFDDDFSSRAGYGKSLSVARDASDGFRSGYGGASLIREAPELEIRSSGYGSLVRGDFDDDFSSRSGYGKALKEEKKDEKSETKKDDAKDEAKSRKKRSFHNLFNAAGYGAQPQVQKVEVIREVPVVKEVIREVPVVREVEVVREVPVVREVEVIREVPVRSNDYGSSSFRSAPTQSRASYARSNRRNFPTRSFSSDFSSDFSDLRESLDIPVTRSAYDDAPVRISFDDDDFRSDFRSDSRYKRAAPEAAPAKMDSTMPKPKPMPMAKPADKPAQPMM